MSLSRFVVKGVLVCCGTALCWGEQHAVTVCAAQCALALGLGVIGDGSVLGWHARTAALDSARMF
jgi:hypothetical protein